MSTAMSTPDRTIETLGQAVTEEMDAEYTLVYVEQGQTLPADVVAAIVRGDNEWETDGGERLIEWAGHVAWNSACDAVDELAKEIVRRWEREDSTDETDADYDELLENEWPGSDERQTAIDTIRERDRSDWEGELVRSYGAVLLRVTIPTMTEDAHLGGTPMTHEEFLDLLGFEHTEENMKLAGDVVDNASPEHSMIMGYAVIGVDLDVIDQLPADGQVEIRNPHVWLGNPFAGSGWCDGPFTGTLTVNRDDLRTDKDAFGYSWGEVVGGTYASDYMGEIVRVTPDSGGSGGDAGPA